MDNNKQIKFKVGFDTQELERDIKKIEQTIKNIQTQNISGAKAQQTLGGDKLLSSYAKQAFGDFSKDSQKNMTDYYEQLRKLAINENINIRAKAQELDKLSKIEGEMTKDQQERVKLLKEEIQLMRDKQRETLSGLAAVKAALPPEQKAAVAQAAQTSPSFMQKFGGYLSAGSAIIAGASRFAQEIDPVAQRYIERDRTLLANRAGAARVSNQFLYDQSQERGSSFVFQQEEMKRSMNSAVREGNAQNVKDTVMATLKAAGGIGGAYAGFKGGAAVGATIGSVVPVVGTAIGTGIGGIGGAMLGASLGSGGILSDSRSMNALTDREAYRAMLTKSNFENFQQNLEAEKILNPRKFLAQEQFLGNYKGYQSLQRQLGFNDEQLFGDNGYFQRGLREGFTQENLMQNTSNILGAGGSTQMAQNPEIAAALQRQYRITNADQVLGRLTSAGMNNNAAEDTTRRIMAEAFSAGLDMSKYGEETRRFVQASADLIAQSGGNTAMAGMLASGLISPDQKGLEQSLAATQTLNQQLGEGTGYTGALKYSYLASKEGQEKFKGIDSKLLNQLVEMDAASLNAQNPIIQQAAAEASKVQGNVSPEDLISRIKDMSSFSYFKRSEADETLGAFEKAASKYSSPMKMQEALEAGTDPELRRAVAYSAAYMGQEGRTQSFVKGGNFREGVSMISQLSNYDNQRGLTTDVTSLAGQMQTQMTAPELQAKSTATDQLGGIQRVQENLGKLAEAAAANTTASKEVALALEAYGKALEKGKGDLEKYQDAIIALMQKANGTPPIAGRGN